MRFPDAFLAELRERTSLVDLVGNRLRLARRGREHVGVCPFHNEKSGSFTVNEAKGFTHCFGCGHHSDAVGFIMKHDNLTFVQVVEQLAALAGMPLPGQDQSAAPRQEPKPRVRRPSQEELDAEKEGLIGWARGVWAGGQPWRGTLVEAYLGARGIRVAGELPTLRFAPSLWHSDARAHLPAMLGAVQQVDGRITGIHRTYLAPDGRGKAPGVKAKKMGGVCWGGAIRLAKAGPRLALGEGIETCLSVRQVFPDMPVWVTGSLGNIAGGGDPDAPRRAHPDHPDKQLPTARPDMDRPGIVLPAEVEEVLILADADGDRPTGEALVERAARRFRFLGRRVRVAWPRPGMDFNDMLVEVA